jgi:pimeloyl-ACP methyl ester carboxylesterase
MSSPNIYGPDPLILDGRSGYRYWVHHPIEFMRKQEIDERLSGFPVAVFRPEGRPAHETPTVIGLQGMAAPYQWNAFLVPTLLDMGIACVLFDTPLAGERSLARNFRGDMLSELVPLLEQSSKVEVGLVPLLMEIVARDIATVVRLIQDRHGLGDSRQALFGVSLGTLLAAYAFMRDGVGARLLGTLGHADLCRFARSYTPRFAPLAASLPGRLLSKFAGLLLGPIVPATVDFLGVLNELCAGGEVCIGSNPMTFLERVTGERRVRFLVGREDHLVHPADALACAQRFPDGACYVVPGMGHGQGSMGPSFVEHVRYFVGTQLGDWRW